MKKTLFFFGLAFSLFAFTISVSANEYQVDQYTAALWHMNEGSGNQVYDKSLHGNDGTIIGGAEWVEGRYNYALKFDGIDDKVSVPYSRSIGELEEVTLEAWIKRSSSADGMVVSKNGPYFLSVRDNKVEGGVYAGNPPSWIHVRGVTQLELNRWYHIAMSYDGSFVRIYLNGFEDASAPKTGNIYVTGQGLHIGWGEPGHNQYFNGIIDEVRISNIARNFTSTFIPAVSTRR